MTKQNLFCGILFCISVVALIIACLAFTKKGGGEEYYSTCATAAVVAAKLMQGNGDGSGGRFGGRDVGGGADGGGVGVRRLRRGRGRASMAWSRGANM